jgi:hypothetical protein
VRGGAGALAGLRRQAELRLAASWSGRAPARRRTAAASAESKAQAQPSPEGSHARPSSRRALGNQLSHRPALFGGPGAEIGQVERKKTRPVQQVGEGNRGSRNREFPGKMRRAGEKTGCSAAFGIAVATLGGEQEGAAAWLGVTRRGQGGALRANRGMGVCRGWATRFVRPRAAAVCAGERTSQRTPGPGLLRRR